MRNYSSSSMDEREWKYRKSLCKSKFNFCKFYKPYRVILKQDLLPLPECAVQTPEAFLAFFCCGTLSVSHSLVLKEASVSVCDCGWSWDLHSSNCWLKVWGCFSHFSCLTPNMLVDLCSISESCLLMFACCSMSTKLGTFFHACKAKATEWHNVIAALVC